MPKTYTLICGNDLCKKAFECERENKVYCCDPCFRDHARRTVKRKGASKIHQHTAGVKHPNWLYRHSGL